MAFGLVFTSSIYNKAKIEMSQNIMDAFSVPAETLISMAAAAAAAVAVSRVMVSRSIGVDGLGPCGLGSSGGRL